MLPTVRMQCPAARLPGGVNSGYSVCSQRTVRGLVYMRKQAVHDAAPKHDCRVLGTPVDVDTLWSTLGVVSTVLTNARIEPRGAEHAHGETDP